MVAQIFCIAAGSGMPLFIRKKGDTESVSFSQIASLNGVYMFAKSHSVEIHNVTLEDCVVCWKEYLGSIMLIAMASGCTTEMVDQFLAATFNALVLSVGIDDLKTIKNAERLKRELRVAYKLVDRLLDILDCHEKNQPSRNQSKTSCADVGGLVETILCQERSSLLHCLESYLDVVESAYGCVSIHGRLAVATPSWWQLSREEKRLLALLISISTGHCSATDTPVFLPIKSPSVPFRLVTLRLMTGVDVSALCGPSPPLSDIEQSALLIWRPAIDALRAAEKTYPRNFPSHMILDANVLGVLLINLSLGKFMFSRNLSTKESCSLPGSHRLTVLRSFFNQAVAKSLILQNDNGVLGSVKETYWCSEYHKSHGLKDRDNIICVLYAASVPNHTVRLLTKQCLKILTSDKHVAW